MELDLKVSVAGHSLETATARCKFTLQKQRSSVELGGLLLGTFDGTHLYVRELLFDERALCTPARIVLSPDVFVEAQHLARLPHTEGPWHLLGTWHGHPPGYSTFSPTDEQALFIEHMRLRADDPSLSETPRVHLIFPGYCASYNNMLAYTMRLRVEYAMQPLRDSELTVLPDAIGRATTQGNSIGLILVRRGQPVLSIERYHPSTFQLNATGEAKIIGFWKYFGYSSISYEFEKVFLENFSRKEKQRRFLYVRVLRDRRDGALAIEPYQCERLSDEWSFEAIVSFQQITATVVADQFENFDGGIVAPES